MFSHLSKFSLLYVQRFFYVLFSSLLLLSPLSLLAGKVLEKERAAPTHEISNCTQLQNMQQHLHDNYRLTQDIDCSETKHWNHGKGFIPVAADVSTPFTGNFEGGHHKIYNLYIHRTEGSVENVGLFGAVKGSRIANVGLINVDIVGGNFGAGALMGNSRPPVMIINSYSTGYIEGGMVAGGLVGALSGLLQDSYSTATTSTVPTSGILGGLVGQIVRNSKVIRCYALGNVDGSNMGPGSFVGGLAGENDGILSNSYATGNVLGYGSLGGLVGKNVRSKGVGALGVIIDSYASGNVQGFVRFTHSTLNLGGLVGHNIQGSISNSYAVGQVSESKPGFSNLSVGGLVGRTEGSIKNSYYDQDRTGQHDTGKGVPKTTQEMYQQSNYDGWDFTHTWKILNGADCPRLAWQTVPLKMKISSVSSPQTVGKTFNITLTASRPYTGLVYLHSERGEIYPASVQMIQGQWQGGVNLYAIGQGNHLAVRWGNSSQGLSGMAVSNVFDVVEGSGSLPHNADLMGQVLDDAGQPVSGARVALYRQNPKQAKTLLAPVMTTETDGSGRYHLNHLLPADFYVQVEKAGYQSEADEIETAAGVTVTRQIELDSACLKSSNGARVPVLLLPGIMGSKSSGVIYPRLPFEFGADKLKLHDPFRKINFGVVGWGKLEKALRKAGYRRGCTLFEVPYDWSLPVTQIRDSYLLPYIKRAKKDAGTTQVDIIAHSMGGLIARSYIQSSAYAKDVRKLAMVGTPNKGSDNSYYPWEGGDPITIDKIAGDTAFYKLGQYFYTNTLNYLYQGRKKKKLCRFGEVLRYQPEGCDSPRVYNFLHNACPSVGNLLSMYPKALVRSAGMNVPIKAEENTFLTALNNQPCLNSQGCVDPLNKSVVYYFYPLSDRLTNDTKGVLTQLFVGTGNKTLSSIKVEGMGPLLYKDGKPQGYERADGDGTTLDSSIIFNNYFPAGKALKVEKKAGKHSELINVFQDSLVKFVSGKAVEGVKTTAPSPSALVLEIRGRVRAHFAGVNSQKIQQNLKLDYSELILPNPTKQSYQVSLTSSHHESYHLSIFYFDPKTNALLGTRMLGYYNKPRTFSFKLHKPGSQDPLITFSRSFSPPTGLTARVEDNRVTLSWQDPRGEVDKDVDHYEIYGLLRDQAFYRYLGKSNTKKYTTTGCSETVYAVKSVLKNGTTTFLSEPTLN